MATLASPRPTNLQAARDDFYDRLAPEALAPLWKVLSALVTPTPRTAAVAAAWSFDRIRPLLMEAGELIPSGNGEQQAARHRLRSPAPARMPLPAQASAFSGSRATPNLAVTD